MSLCRDAVKVKDNSVILVTCFRAGLNFDVAVEGLSVSGNLQLICHMSMDVPFPHVSKVTASFTEKLVNWNLNTKFCMILSHSVWTTMA